MVASGIAALDSTILATAIPTIVADLGGYSQFPWLFSIYILASAVTVPVYSKLADMFGRKPIILIGIGIFLVGSILCAVAWDMPSLIVSRGIQGLGSGAILPIATTMIGDIYTVAERARIQGYVSTVWAVSSVIGPAIGGILAQFHLWRWVFIVNIPLCLLCIWIITRSYHETVARRQHRIDYAGLVLITLASGLLILGMLEGGSAWEWLSPISFAVFGASIVLAVAFVLVERRAAEPIVPLALFRKPVISSGVILNFAIGAGLGALAPFVPVYLQTGIGASPLEAGAALAAFTIGWPLAVIVSGRIYLARGFRFVGVIGGIIMTLAATTLAALAQMPSLWLVAILTFFIGAGFGWTALPSLVSVQSSVDWNQRGVASGLIMFSRSIGQSFSTAVFGAISLAVITAYGGDSGDPQAIISATQAIFVGVVVIALIVLASAFGLPGRTATQAAAHADPRGETIREPEAELGP